MPSQDNQPPSPWSFQIAKVVGIPVRVHFTFILFLIWIGWSSQSRGGWSWVALVCAVFFCVILHEFGHALAARKYGISTLNITMYPIGGVAMLGSRPTPRQEIWVTIAGPLVNFVIAGLLYTYMAVSPESYILSMNFREGGLLPGLFFANLSLGLFNLIPSFPMDGGRLLRAVLATRIGEVRATRIAAGIGQVVAILLGVFGVVTGQVVLMLIAFFVFIVAGQELTSTVTRSYLAGQKVRSAMLRNFVTLPHGATLAQASDALLNGTQEDFPVVSGDDVIGILRREGLAGGLAQDGPNAYVAGAMDRNFLRCSPDDDLESIAEALSQNNGIPTIVLENEQLVGLLTQKNLSEFILIQDAYSRRKLK
jgi:Zn-dependent protease/predicted transcriptional regulator